MAELVPGITHAHPTTLNAAILECVAASANMNVGELAVIVSDSSTTAVTGVRQATLADADAIATIDGSMGVVIASERVDTTATGYRVWLAPLHVLTGVDTSAGAVRDPVYASGTAGGWTLTPQPLSRPIGRVLAADATYGVVELNPMFKPPSIPQQPLLSVNAAASSAENKNSAWGTITGASVSLVAGLWRIGAVLKVSYSGLIALGGTDTVQIRLLFDDGTNSIAVNTTASLTPATGDVFMGEYELTARTVGATAVVVGQGSFTDPVAGDWRLRRQRDPRCNDRYLHRMDGVGPGESRWCCRS
jgi:hypothetical protein